jgi:serine protease inhibitor
VHKADVEVDEQGTEAAAATAGGVSRAASARVVADHPFVYVIRDRLTHSILFVGRISDPSASDG